MDPTERVREVFDEWACSGRAEGMEQGHGQTAGPLLASLPIHAGTRFLDLGCGNGWAARFAHDRGADAAGIDASPEMVRRARSLAAGVRFDAGDFAHLPYPDDHFDLAWSMEALYYAGDPDTVLREVLRVLRPGGALHVVIDHYRENVASHDWPETTGVPMVLRSEPEWSAALAAAGYADAWAERLRTEAGDGVEAWKVEEGSLHLVGIKG